ncbi:LysR family transcriptional regulator [Amaricoccus sp.]|uniref:LysR family transcriptional regulator n=1 Tax=Amaricoccus sp. TaxID=1872485 RepID=UPI0025C7005E|nr:LysR family transcriptional regulator [Amaricoccus sp.]
MDYLNDMALFVEVARTGSFRGAAEAAGVPASTLSRRIAALEASIGLRLLNRTTRKVELTEAGRIYHDRARRIVEEARIAHEELGELVARPTGTLRVSLPVDFATIWLAPILPEFARLYPGIDFDLDLTPRNVDLVSERFDLSIRMARPTSNTLISRVIGRVTAELFAAPVLLQTAEPLRHPSDLERLPCLAMASRGTWTLHAGTQSCELAAKSRFRLNNVALMRSLAVQGMGVVLLPQRAVEAELASGHLVPVLPDWRGAPSAIHAVTETRLLPARVQRFIDFLREKLKTERC